MSKSNSMADSGIYYLSGDVTSDTAEAVVGWILSENLTTGKKRKDSLTLIITSNGGCSNSAFAMVDAMRGSSIPVNTVGLGGIASAGVILFMTGKHRVLTPNTMIMSHQYSWGVRGKSHELMAMSKAFDLSEEIMLRHYITHTGLPKETIMEKLLTPSDVYLTPEEAVKFGIADEVSLQY